MSATRIVGTKRKSERPREGSLGESLGSGAFSLRPREPGTG